MNTLTRRQVLNAAFKRFQRLPDWPITGMRSGTRTEAAPETRQNSDAFGVRGGCAAERGANGAARGRVRDGG